MQGKIRLMFENPSYVFMLLLIGTYCEKIIDVCEIYVDTHVGDEDSDACRVSVCG
jgi:hypothetical protein